MQPQTYSVESGKVRNDQSGQAPIANDEVAKAAASAADAIRLADTASNILPGASEIGSNIASGVGSLFGSGAVEGLDLAASAPAMNAGYELGANSLGATSSSAAGADLTGGTGFSPLAPIVAAYGLYQTGKGWLGSGNDYRDPKGGAISGATAGAAIGSMVPIPGATLIGAAIGALVGGVGEMFGGGKGKDQLIRDKQREAWAKAGFTDNMGSDQAILKLSNGKVYDLGKDGNNFLGHNKDFDYSQPLAQLGVQWLGPAALMLSGGDKKVSENWVRAFTRMLSDEYKATPEQFRDNVYALYQKIGLKPSEYLSKLEELKGQGNIDEGTANLYKASIDQLRAGAPLPDLNSLPKFTKDGLPALPAAPSTPTAPVASDATASAAQASKQLVKNITENAGPGPLVNTSPWKPPLPTPQANTPPEAQPPEQSLNQSVPNMINSQKDPILRYLKADGIQPIPGAATIGRAVRQSPGMFNFVGR